MRSILNERLKFEIQAESGAARVGVLETTHSALETPVFMPVGTAGVVKAMTAGQVEELGAQIILGNTYHLYLRPGLEVLEGAGGLHGFSGWRRSLLTDSGGFQAFSLKKLRKLDDDGVEFRSHLDGSAHVFTPEKVMEIQGVIGSDIAMVLDDCPGMPCEPERLDAALRRSTLWAERAKRCIRPSHQSLFAIGQGGLDIARRLAHLRSLVEIGFDGYALGGLSVGETPPEMHACVREVAPAMPREKPRYLMGVGTPWDLVECVAAGIDMFDCVLPTRTARMGTVYTDDAGGRGRRLSIKRAEVRFDHGPIQEGCECLTCRTVSRAYLRHLYVSNEITGMVLLTLHNLHYYLRLMEEIRRAIRGGTMEELLEAYRRTGTDLAAEPTD